jgi:hypothetical protein
MLGDVRSWLATAQQCCADDYGTLTRGLRTSAFAPIVGVERLWHLDARDDLGFAVRTGGRRCPSRHSLGGWRRHRTWHAVDAFCRRTCPWHLLRGDDAMVRFDEHTLPRGTRKFRIGKGDVTTRNPERRCEKLFFRFRINSGRFLAVRATPGDWGVADLAVPLVPQVLDEGRPLTLHALFDAGAGQADADVRALWDLAGADRRLDVTLRACRYPHRLRQGKQRPSGWFVAIAEPGVCVGAPPKEIRLAETTTVLKGESAAQAVRTIVCREVAPGPKKDRWHPLPTTSAGFPEEVRTVFRTRQHQEQAFRVGVSDAFLDAAPCGSDKESPDRKRPRFHRGPLQRIGWRIALVSNAVGDFAPALAGDFAGCHVRTLRRRFFHRPGTLSETPEARIVHRDRFGGQEAVVPVVDDFPAARPRRPWFGDRQVVLSLTPPHPPRAGP